MAARLLFGSMGWQEKDWLGPFYPEGTKTEDMLALYSRSLPTVEVDSTFYGRPRETAVAAWAQAVPDDFRFALKVPREVTHRRHFEGAGEYFGLFIQRVRALGPKLGAILLQCGREFRPSQANRALLFEFMETQLPQGIRVALELRSAEWYDDALFDLARENGFALAATESEFSSIDLAERILHVQGDALDFAYLRFMGKEALERYNEVQLDVSASLDRWTKIIGELRERVSEIYGFVSDDYSGHAPATARDILARCSV